MSKLHSRPADGVTGLGLDYWAPCRPDLDLPLAAGWAAVGHVAVSQCKVAWWLMQLSLIPLPLKCNCTGMCIPDFGSKLHLWVLDPSRSPISLTLLVYRVFPASLSLLYLIKMWQSNFPMRILSIENTCFEACQDYVKWLSTCSLS